VKKISISNSLVFGLLAKLEKVDPLQTNPTVFCCMFYVLRVVPGGRCCAGLHQGEELKIDRSTVGRLRRTWPAVSLNKPSAFSLQSKTFRF
jgi:hypothetical protein